MKRVDVALAIVLRGSRVLIARRKSTGPFASLWEFPGGKREPDETIEACLHRELWEELAIRAKPITALAPIEHDYPQVHVCLHPYLCRHESGEPQAIACDEVQWVEPVELRAYPFPPANGPLIEGIIATLSEAGLPQRGSKESLNP
ncbi:MAG TPA: 8-oxo-dGTP diphosphatase MutT [Tepidisphaeraceae bacterium]|nr:8-oxo-dGTP diphosphatase MutT [Tepidisphaeraceae bacterium]